MDWFLNLRKIALVGFITGVLSALLQLWTVQPILRNLGWMDPEDLLGLILSILILLFIASIPLVFLWLLHTNPISLIVPRYARQVAMAAGLGLLIPEIRDGISLARLLVFDLVSLSALLSLGFSFSLILILAALARENDQGSDSEAAVTTSFRRITRVALITGYVFISAEFIRIVSSRAFISMLVRNGANAPTESVLLREILTHLWLVACVTAIPFVVSRSLPPVAQESTESE